MYKYSGVFQLIRKFLDLSFVEKNKMRGIGGGYGRRGGAAIINTNDL